MVIKISDWNSTMKDDEIKKTYDNTISIFVYNISSKA